MKKLVESKSVVEINRRIEIEEINGTDFAYYIDTKEIETNGVLEKKIKKGVTSMENLKAVNGMDSINDVVFAPKMSDEKAIIVPILKNDFQKVLNGEKHITEIIENTKMNDISFSMVDDYMFVLWNWQSYKIADLFYKFISLPIKFGYMFGSVENETYNLEALLEKLKKDENVLNRETLKIKNIPSWNAYKGRDKTIEFLYLLPKDSYQKVAEMNSFDIPYYVLKEFIGADKFKINED